MDITQNLVSLLRTCTSAKSISYGKLIHQRVLTLGLRNNFALCKHLINFYFSCHIYDYATLVFRTIDNPSDIALLNGLLASYTKNFMFVEALELFDKLMHFPSVTADEYTYPSVVKACGELGRACYGKMLHTRLAKTGFLSDVFVSSSLVTMYAKCDVFGCAMKVFDEIPEKDVGCWNSVISSCYHHGQPGKVVELFDEMSGAGVEPNSVTLTLAISSCARLLDLERGKRIHRESMRTGLLSRGFVRNSLVDMYGKCGSLEMAKQVFEQIPEKSVVACNSMVTAYSLKGDVKSCFELLERMRNDRIRPTLTTFSSLLLVCIKSAQLHHGKCIHGYLVRNRIEPDIYINGLLIDMYFECGNVSYAKNVFSQIPEGNVVYSNMMVSGYVSTGHYFEALVVYDSMKENGIRPDAITFTSVLPACSKLAALEKGKEICESVAGSTFEDDELVMGALLDMYAKCGALDEAIGVFQKLPKRDLVSCTSMITAYGYHARALEAVELFLEMENSNEKPDGVAFLAIMSACSHGGLIDQGYYFFNQMINEYRIEPSVAHYSCLMDLFGRAGRLREAYRILQEHDKIRDDVDSLSTLLSACCLHKDVDLGVKVATLLMEKNPGDPSTYVTLSSIYASDGKWNECRKLRMKMKELGLRKKPGCSWIEIDKRVHTFFAEDDRGPQTVMICEYLKFLTNHMEINAYDLTLSS